MARTIAQSYNVANENRMYVTSAILAACVLLAVMYAFNIYRLVSRTVAIQDTESETAALNSQVNSLASSYLALSSELTPDTMQSFGLSEGQVSYYISKTASMGHVAVNGMGM